LDLIWSDCFGPDLDLICVSLICEVAHGCTGVVLNLGCCSTVSTMRLFSAIREIYICSGRLASCLATYRADLDESLPLANWSKHSAMSRATNTRSSCHGRYTIVSIREVNKRLQRGALWHGATVCQLTNDCTVNMAIWQFGIWVIGDLVIWRAVAGYQRSANALCGCIDLLQLYSVVH
jgi:hypothetical protein